MFKCFTDVSIDIDGVAAISYLIEKDGVELKHGCLAVKFPDSRDSTEGEIVAILNALSVLEENGYRPCQMATDNLSVIESLNRGSKNRRLKDLYTKLDKALSRLRDIDIVWISRAANKAHALARGRMLTQRHTKRCKSWVEQVKVVRAYEYGRKVSK